jgi:hypothetical protein
MYAASGSALNLLIAANITIITWFLKEFEIPALLDWNPFMRDTPSESNPRTGYQLVLNDANFGVGFNI